MWDRFGGIDLEGKRTNVGGLVRPQIRLLYFAYPLGLGERLGVYGSCGGGRENFGSDAVASYSCQL